MAAKSKTHYEVLEISKNAKLIDIKKAYRRLALKHHPDRNGGSTESTERFKEISEAYTVLSSPSSRSDYDLALKFPSSVSPAAATSSNAQQSYQGVSDPFRQFNDLFRNDPFFHEAFQDMDDAFSKRFDNSNDEHRDEISSVADRWPILGCGTKKAQKAEKKNVPWTKWLMDKLGIELEVSSFSHGADGSVTSSNYSSKATRTLNKQTKTYVENGRQVTVMSLEKNGNSIEDKFVGGELVERRVNGKLEAISQVAAN